MLTPFSLPILTPEKNMILQINDLIYVVSKYGHQLIPAA